MADDVTLMVSINGWVGKLRELLVDWPDGEEIIQRFQARLEATGRGFFSRDEVAQVLGEELFPYESTEVVASLVASTETLWRAERTEAES